MKNQLDKEYGPYIYKFHQFGSNGDDFALDSLKNTAFYMNSIAEFNDPFEGQVVSKMPEYSQLLDAQYIDVAKKFAKIVKKPSAINSALEINNGRLSYEFLCSMANPIIMRSGSNTAQRFGIVCLSKDLQSQPHPLSNPLMWSHYTNGFRGFCIEFNWKKLLQEMAKKGVSALDINYQQERPVLDIFQACKQLVGYSTDQNPSYLYFKYKSQHWAYENEIRLVHPTICKAEINYCPSSINKVVISALAGQDKTKKIVDILRHIGVKTYGIASIMEKGYGVTVIEKNVV